MYKCALTKRRENELASLAVPSWRSPLRASALHSHRLPLCLSSGLSTAARRIDELRATKIRKFQEKPDMRLGPSASSSSVESEELIETTENCDEPIPVAIVGASRGAVASEYNPHWSIKTKCIPSALPRVYGRPSMTIAQRRRLRGRPNKKLDGLPSQEKKDAERSCRGQKCNDPNAGRATYVTKPLAS